MAETLLDFAKREFKRMDEDHEVRAKAWVKWHKQFRGILETSRNGIAKSRLFIQRTKVACMAGVANVADIIFPSDDFFDAIGRNDPDTAVAETTKKLMIWALKNGRFFHETVLYILQAVIYGTTFGKIVPTSTTETRLDKIPRMLSPEIPIVVGMDVHEVKTTVKLAKIETVDIFDFWIDPAATSIEDASGMFHRFRRTLGYLKGAEQKKLYRNIEQVEALILASKGGADTKGSDRRRSSVGLPMLDYYSEDISLYEYHGKVPAEIAKNAGIKVLPGEVEVECILTFANMEILLRAERNEMINQTRMFVSDVWEPSGDRSIYGRGIPENVRGSQQALNVTVNLRLDNKAWAIAAPLVVNLDKLENPNEDLVARVNWVIRGKGASPAEIAQFAQIPDMTGNSIMEAQEFERHIDEESAINKSVQATQSFGSNRTLGGISLAYSAAARPIRLIAKGFEDNLISQGLKKTFYLLWQSMDDKITVRVTDDPKSPEYLHDLDRLSLALDVDFVASGSFALAQRDQTVQSMTAFFDALSKLPMLTRLPNWNWKWMVQKFYEAVGLKDFNKAWLEQPPAQAGVTPGAPSAGGAPSGTIPPELLAMLGGANDNTPPQSGRSGGSGGTRTPQGNGALSILAELGQMAQGGAGASAAGMA